MILYAYADETELIIDKTNNQNAIGCGILVSKTKIDDSLISTAIGCLKSDPDFDKKKTREQLTGISFMLQMIV